MNDTEQLTFALALSIYENILILIHYSRYGKLDKSDPVCVQGTLIC